MFNPTCFGIRNTFIPRASFDYEPIRVTCVPYNVVHPVAKEKKRNTSNAETNCNPRNDIQNMYSVQNQI